MNVLADPETEAGKRAMEDALLDAHRRKDRSFAGAFHMRKVRVGSSGAALGGFEKEARDVCGLVVCRPTRQRPGPSIRSQLSRG